MVRSSSKFHLRTAAVLTLSLFVSLLAATPSIANTKVWETVTPSDTYNRPDLNPQYDVVDVSVGLWSDDLDMVNFWIRFKNPLRSDQFNDGRGSWAGIFIDTNDDEIDDLRIETKNYSYSKNYSQPAYASKNCNAVTWMNMDAGTSNVYLGFKVSQKCLGLPNKFWVYGYADFIEDDDTSFDYAPSAFSLIDLGDYYNPKPKVTATLPFANSNFGANLANYSTPPSNLASLSSELKKSVVTIECKLGTLGSSGSGWSANVNMLTTNPYASYIITNYHVISDCIFRGTVDVITSEGSRYVGTLAAWDPDNDLAGIYLTARIPPLLWRGPTPVQGGWVGVIGSPIGLPSVLTTGIVSSVNTQESWITFTAPINPGNSGGPVFDSVGRVIAIATAKAKDSEGFGIGQGTPLICKVILSCQTTSSTVGTGWTGASIVPIVNPDNSNQGAVITTVKKKTIKCVKGNIVKTVKAKNPKCPSGYKKRR